MMIDPAQLTPGDIASATHFSLVKQLPVDGHAGGSFLILQGNGSKIACPLDTGDFTAVFIGDTDYRPGIHIQDVAVELDLDTSFNVLSAKDVPPGTVIRMEDELYLVVGSPGSAGVVRPVRMISGLPAPLDKTMVGFAGWQIVAGVGQSKTVLHWVTGAPTA